MKLSSSLPSPHSSIIDSETPDKVPVSCDAFKAEIVDYEIIVNSHDTHTVINKSNWSITWFNSIYVLSGLHHWISFIQWSEVVCQEKILGVLASQRQADDVGQVVDENHIFSAKDHVWLQLWNCNDREAERRASAFSGQNNSESHNLSESVLWKFYEQSLLWILTTFTIKTSINDEIFNYSGEELGTTKWFTASKSFILFK